MTCGSAERVTVFILHLALDDTIAIPEIMFRRRYFRVPFARRTEARARETKWRRDFTCENAGKNISRENLERLAQKDKADVGVFGASAGRGFERHLQGSAQNAFRRGMGGEELPIPGQTRRVRQQ